MNQSNVIPFPVRVVPGTRFKDIDFARCAGLIGELVVRGRYPVFHCLLHFGSMRRVTIEVSAGPGIGHLPFHAGAMCELERGLDLYWKAMHAGDEPHDCPVIVTSSQDRKAAWWAFASPIAVKRSLGQPQES
jgi:hypothetical protein